ncbi:MAG: hypothetical protein GY866_40930 [Proteobacteria bacterium]|nr:hypothetical protein [Pseudomonadota bacterium]
MPKRKGPFHCPRDHILQPPQPVHDRLLGLRFAQPGVSADQGESAVHDQILRTKYESVDMGGGTPESLWRNGEASSPGRQTGGSPVAA